MHFFIVKNYLEIINCLTCLVARFNTYIYLKIKIDAVNSQSLFSYAISLNSSGFAYYESMAPIKIHRDIKGK